MSCNTYPSHKKVTLRKAHSLSSSSSTFQDLKTVPERLTSHGTIKQQLVNEFSVHPDLAGIAVATLKRGQSIERHVHESMHEFFYILEGAVSISTTEQHSMDRQQQLTLTRPCLQGCFYHTVPGDPHAFAVPSDASQDAKMLVIQLLSKDK